MRKALKIAAANQTRSNQLQTPLSESVKMSQVVDEKMPSCGRSLSAHATSRYLPISTPITAHATDTTWNGVPRLPRAAAATTEPTTRPTPHAAMPHSWFVHLTIRPHATPATTAAPSPASPATSRSRL